MFRVAVVENTNYHPVRFSFGLLCVAIAVGLTRLAISPMALGLLRLFT